MSPTFLVAGATGNTGRSVVKTLSELVKTKTDFSDYRILATTRSANGIAATQLAQLPSVDVVELSWVEITADWLREYNVNRAFIASHNEPNQFAEESTFLLNARNAGLEYVVRISTTAANVRPDCPAYYPRSHWAVEAMLSSPEFERLQWTSLQPNIFTNFYFYSVFEWVKNFRETGTQGILKLLPSEYAPVGVIDSDDVGVVAAHLLTAAEPSVHNKARYVLNGPEDITGRQVVELLEKHVGTKVENVVFKDMSVVEHMAAHSKESKNVILSMKHALETSWDGKCSASTTSKEILHLAAPTRTPREAFEAMLQE